MTTIKIPHSLMEKQSSKLDRSTVIWTPYYTLDRASFGQIMKSLEKVKIIPKNNYETVLSKELQLLISQIINQFDNLLYFTNNIEANVFHYNLLGPLPKNLTINEEEHKEIKLKTANVGNLLKALYQRINFILQRDVPLMYQNKPDYLSAFEKMRSNIRTFLAHVQEFEKGFVTAIDKAHKSKNN